MWGFEKRWVDPAEVDTGPFPAVGLKATGFITLILLILAWPRLAASLGPQSLIVALSAPLLARAITIDMKHLLLLNVYVLPLTVIGIVAFPWLYPGLPWWHGLAGAGAAFGVGLLLSWMVHLLRRGGEMGLGDVKMLACIGAWVGLMNLPFALSVACIAHFIWLCVAPRKVLPFGPALGLGMWVVLCWQHVLWQLLR